MWYIQFSKVKNNDILAQIGEGLPLGKRLGNETRKEHSTAKMLQH